ncbi:MAG: GntR family transcriptional regulator [Renibacterium sp.]|nr:GntR family transcriptional regulator [Renibacterium sp.]
MHYEPDGPAVEGAESPNRSVLADELYETVKAALLSRQIAPGSKINLDELSRKLHVSNTPLRQAMSRLQADGLVTKVPYQGFSAVALLDTRSVAELYEYRLMLEPQIAGLAARRRTAERAEALGRLVDEAETVRVSEGTDPQLELQERDIEFHLGVAAATKNSTAADLLGSALTRMRHYTLYHRPSAALQAWEEHREVAEAIAAGDALAASAAMQRHLAASLDRMRRILSTRL